ncbi:hypothetical protein, partial [Alkalilimnicola ehrlichii]|uniref:hypothetical protein n=1 Tax=Alkalilimnicola ehrlichii TaxID=351052 RepID=UPI001C6F456B
MVGWLFGCRKFFLLWLFLMSVVKFGALRAVCLEGGVPPPHGGFLFLLAQEKEPKEGQPVVSPRL